MCFAVFHNFGSVVLYTFLKKIAVLPLKTYKTYGIIVVYDKGNTAQRASGDFARHLLANFSSYFTKMLVNTSSIHSAFCFI